MSKKYTPEINGPANIIMLVDYILEVEPENIEHHLNQIKIQANRTINYIKEMAEAANEDRAIKPWHDVK